ncbi:MAG: phosphate-starvation-inducible PsiE family protein [Oscillatoriales cyanobacterium SM2_2_1]|nr:phosphate-starvation-inducible PsiE family protein [Oscillatoriales cyanobacterium SM2_2_1]
MVPRSRWWQRLAAFCSDAKFLHLVSWAENAAAKVLAIAMLIVLVISLGDLILFLFVDLRFSSESLFRTELITIFGRFLSVLIALEILQNIAAYLKQHTIQLELVVITSLTAVARKIIIFDAKNSTADIGGLAIATLCLALSYWIIRHLNRSQH